MIRTSALTLLAALAIGAEGGSPTPAPAPAPAVDAKPADAKPAESAAVTLSNKQKASYLIGANMAGAVKEYDLEVALVLQGLQDTVAGKASLVPKEQAQDVFKAFQAEAEAAKSKLADGRKATNATWLAENAKKPGIKTTPSGLQYEVIAATAKKDAKKPTAADQVKVNYTGSLLDGTVFDASANHGGPATFGVGQVIKGWTEALQLMSEGDKYKLYIPAELAYGAEGPPSIGPNQILTFEVELVEVLGSGGPATFKP